MPYLCVFTLILLILSVALVFVAISTARRAGMLVDDSDEPLDSPQVRSLSF